MADAGLVDAARSLRTGRRRRELFDACVQRGTVSFDYDTRIFAGHPA